MAYFNPLDKFCKSSIGAIRADTTVTFRLKSDKAKCVLVINRDGTDFYDRKEMKKENGYFELSFSLKRGLYWYFFDFCDGFFLGLGQDFNGILTDNPVYYQLSVYSADYKVPELLKGGIIYQIFPDRFYSSNNNKKAPKGKIIHKNWEDTPYFLPNEKGQVLNNDFFGGDLKGIEEKLDYIKSLGVTAIYLNPIFKAYSNHRYDTGDYMQIDELLGTEEDFKSLMKSAKNLGISVILDGVFNHSGDDSIYFNKYNRYDSVGAYQSKNSPYYSWYNFIEYPDIYESWWGIMNHPAFNKNNEEFIDFICGENGVLDRYTKLGVSGWRLDVVDELPAHFVRRIREGIKKADKNAIIIGEVWEDASNKVSYGVRREYFLGKELDSVMNYPLKNAILNFVTTGDGCILKQTVLEQLDHYPKAVLDSLMNIMATHDTFRLLSALGDVSVNGLSKSEQQYVFLSGNDYFTAREKLFSAVILQYTLYGVPSIYYGDEIGMQGYSDPLNRRAFTWDKIDGEINDFYKLLGNIRNAYSIFADGEIYDITSDKGLFSFKRKNDDCEVAVYVNLSSEDKILRFNGDLMNLLDGKTYNNSVLLNRNKSVILVNEVK